MFSSPRTGLPHLKDMGELSLPAWWDQVSAHPKDGREHAGGTAPRSTCLAREEAGNQAQVSTAPGTYALRASEENETTRSSVVF